MAAPMDIERVVRRGSLDDLHGIFFLENDVDSNASEGELNRNDKEPETRSFGRHETENVKEQYGKAPTLRTTVSSDSEITATGIASGQEKISDSQDTQLDGLPPHVILLINNEEEEEEEEEEETKEELDVKVDVHHLPPSGNLRSSSDRLKDSADDTLNSFAARHCVGKKCVAAQGPTRDLSDVSFQRKSLPRSQTCPVITTSAFSRSQLVAVHWGTDDNKTSITYPLGFSHKWSLVLASDIASQDASRLRSHTFSNEKDVQHLQQRQQQQQASTLAETSPPRRGRSHSESDLHDLRLKGVGRAIRRMSDEFVSWRSKRTLTTVREEDADSSVDGVRYSSSFPSSTGTFYAYW